MPSGGADATRNGICKNKLGTCLQIEARVPVGVVDDDCAYAGQVDAEAARPRRQQEDPASNWCSLFSKTLLLRMLFYCHGARTNMLLCEGSEPQADFDAGRVQNSTTMANSTECLV